LHVFDFLRREAEGFEVRQCPMSHAVPRPKLDGAPVRIDGLARVADVALLIAGEQPKIRVVG